jgi:hypothetical protein
MLFGPCQTLPIDLNEVQVFLSKVGFLLCCFSIAPYLHAQAGFSHRWEARASATQSKQPSWAPPMVTTFVGLIQVVRIDFTRQISPARATTWNYDSSKGVDIIPWADTEIDINLPPYLQHSAPGTKDGAGDLSFLYKYRILARDAQHGSFVLSTGLQASVPTGSYKNGSTDASLGPTLGMGKGFGRFDIQGTLSAALPTSDGDRLGRTVTWNTVAQYHLGRYAWPEIESNAVYFHGGSNDGKSQEFVTPGIVIGKVPLYFCHSPSRLGLGFGAAEQIAVSRFHTYNHGLIFSGRFLF